MSNIPTVSNMCDLCPYHHIKAGFDGVHEDCIKPKGITIDCFDTRQQTRGNIRGGEQEDG